MFSCPLNKSFNLLLKSPFVRIFLIFLYLLGEPYLFSEFQPVARGSVLVVNIYQKIVSSNLKKRGVYICKFEPTCSEYTKQAIIKYGFLRGSLLGIWRIMRCSPCSHGGYDPLE